jgi:hypothetical protein
VGVSYTRASSPERLFRCCVRLKNGHTPPKLSVLIYEGLCGSSFRRFIICAVKVDSTEQVTELVQYVNAIVRHCIPPSDCCIGGGCRAQPIALPGWAARIPFYSDDIRRKASAQSDVFKTKLCPDELIVASVRANKLMLRRTHRTADLDGQ